MYSLCRGRLPWPLAEPGSDRIGSDRIGLDRTGPDRTGQDRIGSGRIGSDRQNLDRINNKVLAQSRHMKSLGHHLRLLPTIAGVLQEKVRTRASFNKVLTNYTLEESLENVVYDNKYCLSEFSFW